MSEAATTQVTTFEPHPQTHQTLLRILAANQRNNVKVIQKPLSDRALTLTFTDDSFNPMNKVITEATDAPTIQIHSTTGATICESLGHAPDLMKIDTEGHEAEVLRGFGPWLDRVKIVMIEENIDPKVMLECLPKRSFVGPLYLDFKAKHFSQQRQWPEDAFFLHHAVIPQLEQIGFSIAPQLSKI
jgi:FkbM family methyltransferase